MHAAGPSGTGRADAVLAHRDLHDGQILCAPGSPEGTAEPGGHRAGAAGRGGTAGETVSLTVLDWDTAAWAHPAVLLSALPIGSGPSTVAKLYGLKAGVTSGAIPVSHPSRW